jgi:hypothetical protein
MMMCTTLQAIREAQEYADEAILPQAFSPEALNATAPSTTDKAGSPTSRMHTPSSPQRPFPLLTPTEMQLPEPTRRCLSVQRHLGLVAPWNSPYRIGFAPNPALVSLARAAHLRTHAEGGA